MIVLPLSLPLSLRNITIDYCFYPKKYLPELTEKLTQLRTNFDSQQESCADIAGENLVVMNADSSPRLFPIQMVLFRHKQYKEAIIFILFHRENKRREVMGLSKNEYIFNTNIGNRVSINY